MEEGLGDNGNGHGFSYQVPVSLMHVPSLSLTMKCVHALQSNPCEFLKLEDLPTYLSLLLQENGASICNYSFSVFVLQEFDLNRRKLIVSVQSVKYEAAQYMLCV